MKFEEIISELKKKIYRPIYVLCGKEAYYIDEITHYIANNVLNESERAFNQFIFYGKDSDLLQIISQAKKFPMMANHQVIIIKEAQDIKGILNVSTKDKPNHLLKYAEKPVPSTILVVGYKIPSDSQVKISAGFAKALGSNSLLFESNSLYDNEVPRWISQYIKNKGFQIDEKGVHLLHESVGNNLSALVREIEKLIVALPAGTQMITADSIEKNIGISKDFNIFELQKALSNSNATAIMRITHYLALQQSDKVIAFVALLFDYFVKVLKYHTFKNKFSEAELLTEMGVGKYFLKDYAAASQRFSVQKIQNIISLLREYDLKTKGLGSTDDKAELFKELIMKIMYA